MTSTVSNSRDTFAGLAIAFGAFAAVGWAATRRDTGETQLVLAPAP